MPNRPTRPARPNRPLSLFPLLPERTRLLRKPPQGHGTAGHAAASFLASSLIAVGAGGCGAPSQDASEATPGKPLAAAAADYSQQPTEIGAPGGSITLSSSADPKTLNPIVAKETSTTAVTGFMFEGLTRTNGVTTEVEPNLAASWDISEDGLRWVFHLRRDVVWFDGQPFTAHDVVFTFNDLIYNPDVPTSSRDIFLIEGVPVGVKALDDWTVEFTLAKPFAPFLRALGQEIMPAHRLRASVDAGTFASTWGLDAQPQDIVGTGPFMLAQYRPGQMVRLVRNPRYWRRDAKGQPLPYLDEVRLLIVQTEDVALLKFQEGELDVYGLRGSDYAILKPEEARGGFRVYEMGPAFGTSFLCFNQNRESNPTTGQSYVSEAKQRWFTDVRFRRAVAHAIDKQSIIDIVMNGLGYPQHAAMSPSAGTFYNERVATYAYDVERARRMLAEAGYTDRNGDGVLEDPQGVTVEFQLVTNAGNTERVQIANMIRKDLERIGLRVHFSQLEFNTLVSKLDANYDWDAIILGLTGGIEPHFGRNVWHSSGHLHMWYPRQPQPATEWEAEIDRIFDAGVQELDPAKRKALYDRWQQIVAEQLPFIYTVLPPSISAVRDRFGNLKPTAFGGSLHNIEEIFVRPGK